MNMLLYCEQKKKSLLRDSSPVISGNFASELYVTLISGKFSSADFTTHSLLAIVEVTG